MRNKILLLLLAPLLALSVQAQIAFNDSISAWSVNDLPMPHLQDSLRYTINPDLGLTAADVDTLDAVSYDLEHRFGVEMVCVMVGRVAGGDVYEWGDSLFTKYGFGKKGTDNGLLIVVSAVDRQWRIFPGKGLEGVLPDAVCNRIGNRLMVPYMKQGQWGEAMRQAAYAIHGILSQDPDYAEFTAFDEESDDDLGGAIGVISVIGLGIGALAYFGRKKCPKCKTYMKVTQRVLVSRTANTKTYQVTYVCPKCGHTQTDTERVNISSGSSAGGAIMGGALGSAMRGGGGGGFSGGSFGGGSFGGGGAGGRF